MPTLYASVRVEKLIRGMKVKGVKILQHRPTLHDGFEYEHIW